MSRTKSKKPYRNIEKLVATTNPQKTSTPDHKLSQIQSRRVEIEMLPESGNKQPSVKKKSRVRISKLFPHIIAVAALVISIISATFTYRSYTDLASSEAIREQYQDFYQLAQVQAENAQLAHIFTLSDKYDEVFKQVKESASGLSGEERLKMILKERSLAMYIFTVFEHLVYQSYRVQSFGDQKRITFYREMLEYFTTKLLRNPRLLYFWDESGGSLGQHYEVYTRDYYTAHVLQGVSPINKFADIVGPFGG